VGHGGQGGHGAAAPRHPTGHPGARGGPHARWRRRAGRAACHAHHAASRSHQDDHPGPSPTGQDRPASRAARSHRRRRGWRGAGLERHHAGRATRAAHAGARHGCRAHPPSRHVRGDQAHDYASRSQSRHRSRDASRRGHVVSGHSHLGLVTRPLCGDAHRERGPWGRLPNRGCPCPSASHRARWTLRCRRRDCHVTIDHSPGAHPDSVASSRVYHIRSKDEAHMAHQDAMHPRASPRAATMCGAEKSQFFRDTSTRVRGRARRLWQAGGRWPACVRGSAAHHPPDPRPNG
jgi:hypothetical protein